jgi:chloride channel protein, CIC family
LMIFETTHDYAVIVPLMISNMVSFFISARLQPVPIYEALAIQDGIHLPTLDSRQRPGQRQVGDVMRAATEVMQSQMTVREAFEKARAGEIRAWPIIDERGVAGIISHSQLEEAVANGKENKPLQDFASAIDFPHVHADHPLHLALERMGAAKLDMLPVVSRANIHRLLGVIALPDVLNSFGIERRPLN